VVYLRKGEGGGEYGRRKEREEARKGKRERAGTFQLCVQSR